MRLSRAAEMLATQPDLTRILTDEMGIPAEAFEYIDTVCLDRTGRGMAVVVSLWATLDTPSVSIKELTLITLPPHYVERVVIDWDALP